MKLFFASLGMLLATSSMSGLPSSGLDRLMFEGPDLHPSLTAHVIDGAPVRHVSGDVIQTNPQVSGDIDFVKAIARSGSQGKLDGNGVNAALYARYDGEKDVGFYGLQATSMLEAERIETLLREIWAHNVSLNRAHIHRDGLTLVVVWNDGVPADVWQAVNASVADRLTAP